MEEVVEEVAEIDKAQQEAAARQDRDPVMCLGFDYVVIHVIDASVKLALRIL